MKIKHEQIKYYQNIHFIGIGGIGMSGLASLLKEKGATISGSDNKKSKKLTELEKNNIKIFLNHDEKNISEIIDLVVYSNAIDLEKNPEIIKARKHGIPIIGHMETIGLLSSEYFTIAITGTHGKTTITALTAETLLGNEYDPTVLIGTHYKNFDNKNYRNGNDKYLIVEACEYKKAFLNIKADILLISGIEHDHFDCYEKESDYINAYEKMIENIKPEGKLVYYSDDKKLNELVKKFFKIPTYPYSSDEINTNLDFLKNLKGDHNKINALGAFRISQVLMLDSEKSKKAISKFKGTERRMEFKGKIENTLIFDDYAHHPTAIKATLKAIKEDIGEGKILCVYQPHQYSRALKTLKDLKTSFENAEKVIVPDIYEARDTKEDKQKITAETIRKEINSNQSDKCLPIDGKDNTAEYIKKNYRNYSAIIIMGAGDINEIIEKIPLKTIS